MRVDAFNVPLDKQVPQTTQSYVGVGGEVIALTGERNFIVSDPAMVGQLDVTLTQQQFYNMIGRSVNVVLTGDQNADTVFTLPAGTEFVSSVYVAAHGLDTFTVLANAVFTHTFIFVDEVHVAIV